MERPTQCNRRDDVTTDATDPDANPILPGGNYPRDCMYAEATRNQLMLHEMITQKVIDQLYKDFRKPPHSADDLDIDLLFAYLLDNHDIAIDDNANLIIGSQPENSPFRVIPLRHVHAIVEFEKRIAVVLHSSILFLNKNDNKSSIHIKMPRRSILERIFNRTGDED